MEARKIYAVVKKGEACLKMYEKTADRNVKTLLKSKLDHRSPVQIGKHLESERSEEPLVLSRGVLLLKDSLDLLLGVLALRRLLEGVLSNGTLETLEFECVTGRHEVVVRDNLDKRLDLGSLGNLLGTHALGHLTRVSLNTGSNNEGERVLLGAVIKLLDDDNLLISSRSKTTSWW